MGIAGRESMRLLKNDEAAFRARGPLLRNQAIYSAAKFLNRRSVSYKLFFQQMLKVLQIFFVNIGNRPVVEVAFNPME